MSRDIPGPFEAQEMRRFLDTLLYEPEAFLIDRVVLLDADSLRIEALMDTTRPLPYTAPQRPSETHPAHVAAPEILMLTGNLGFCTRGSSTPAVGTRAGRDSGTASTARISGTWRGSVRRCGSNRGSHARDRVRSVS